MGYYILDNNFEIKAIVEKYESLIWTPKYYEAGDFELYLPANEQWMKLLTTAANDHYYLVNEDDTSSVMIATKIEKVRDVNSYNHISLTGYDAKWLLHKRIVWGTAYLSGNIQTELRRLVTNNIIDPKLQERAISNIVLGPKDPDINNIISTKITGEYLDTAITTLCKLYHIGWDVKFDYENKKFEVIFYKGKDRTHSQSTNRRVIFSIDNDNLISTTHKIDTTNFRNVVYVDGSIKELDKTTSTSIYGDTTDTSEYYKVTKKPVGQVVYLDNTIPTGMDRYECFVEGGEEDATEDTSGASNFRYSLRTKGLRELDKMEISTDVSGKVVPNITNFLGVNYDLGDEVDVINEYEQIFKVRIIEVVKSSNNKGYNEVPTFAFEDPNKDPDEIKEEDCFATDTGSDFEYLISEEGEILIEDIGYADEDLISEDGQKIITEYNRVKIICPISQREKEINDLALSSHIYK